MFPKHLKLMILILLTDSHKEPFVRTSAFYSLSITHKIPGIAMIARNVLEQVESFRKLILHVCFYLNSHQYYVHPNLMSIFFILKGLDFNIDPEQGFKIKFLP